MPATGVPVGTPDSEYAAELEVFVWAHEEDAQESTSTSGREMRESILAAEKQQRSNEQYQADHAEAEGIIVKMETSSF